MFYNWVYVSFSCSRTKMAVQRTNCFVEMWENCCCIYGLRICKLRNEQTVGEIEMIKCCWMVKVTFILGDVN